MWLLGACATLPPGGAILAHSRTGEVTAADLERYALEHGLPPLATDAPAAEKRRRIEDLVVVRAAEAEALRLHLADTETFQTDLKQRQERILVAAMRERLEAAARAAVAVTDADIAQAIAQRPPPSSAAERLRLRQIFKRLPAHAPADERQRIEEEIRALRRQLSEGADFGVLARTHSDSQTSVFDGLVAPMALADLGPTLAGPISRLQVGEISEVLETPAGFHVFRLEARLPAQAPPTTDLLAPAIRNGLEQKAFATALKRAFDGLLTSSGARFDPAPLDEPSPPGDEVLFALGGESISLAEVRASWQELAFIARRTTTLRSILEDQIARILLLHAARTQHLDSEPTIALDLDRARHTALLEAAYRRRREALAAGLADSAWLAGQEKPRPGAERPERRRLSGILVPIPDPRSANALYDELDLVARHLREGVAELATEARRLSRDPSRFDDGDLGWAEERELALWAGPRLPRAVFTLPAGAVSAPLLVEAHNESHFRDEPIAYLVVRVEEIRPPGEGNGTLPPAELEARYLSDHAREIGQTVRAGFLAGQDLVIDGDRM